MQRNRRFVLLAVVAVVLAAAPLLLAATLRTLKSRTPIEAGGPSPDFSLAAQDGRRLRLADYRGRPVFLVFVPNLTDAATVRQVRSLADTNHDFDKAGAKVFVISASDPATARALHEKERLPFPILGDPDGATAAKFGVRGKRVSYVVAPSGDLAYRVTDVRPATHGAQLQSINNCCEDERTLAMAKGIGKKIGDFSLPSATNGDGAMTTVFGSDGAQKATALFFLSVKCPCSNAYNDRIKALADTYTARGIRFVGIYANHDETAEEIAAHARDHGFTFPILRDENGLGAAHFKAAVTPEVYVLDDTHVLRYQGRIDDSRDPAAAKTHELRDALDALLAGKKSDKQTRSFGCAIVRE